MVIYFMQFLLEISYASQKDFGFQEYEQKIMMIHLALMNACKSWPSQL